MTTKTTKPEMSRRIALKALVGAGLVMLSVTALVPQAFAQGASAVDALGDGARSGGGLPRARDRAG